MDNLRKAFKRLLNESLQNNDVELVHEPRFLTSEDLARASQLRNHRHEYNLPMLHTRESIMQALHLDPDFRGVPGAPPGRATGRTIGILIDAAVALQHDRVVVVGYHPRYTRELIRSLEQICSQVGISPSNLIRVHAYHDDVDREVAHLGYPLSEVRIFHDHYWGAEYSPITARQIYEIGEIADMMPPSLVSLQARMDAISRPTTFPTAAEMLGIDRKCSKCKFSSGLPHLRCAPFPTGKVSDCPHFEAKQ